MNHNYTRTPPFLRPSLGPSVSHSSRGPHQLVILTFIIVGSITSLRSVNRFVGRCRSVIISNECGKLHIQALVLYCTFGVDYDCYKLSPPRRRGPCRPWPWRGGWRQQCTSLDHQQDIKGTVYANFKFV